jgi:hypothetical protein
LRYLFVTLYLVSSAVYASQSEKTPSTVIINLPTASAAASAEANVNAAITQAMTTMFTITMKQKIKDMVDPETYRKFTANIKDLLWNCRYRVAGATLLGTYSVVSALLLIDYYHKLNNSTLWGRWKTECSFEDLCTMSQKTLTQELLHEINTQYYKKDNPTDFAYPLTTFLEMIDIEIATCKRYLAITSTIKRLRLTCLFPTNDAKIDDIEKVLARALFIKHLFLAWLAEFNVAVTSSQTVINGQKVEVYS